MPGRHRGHRHDGGGHRSDGRAVRPIVCRSERHRRARIEELQFTLGEGPCVDAYRQDRPVSEPDLADPAVPRWIAYSPLAVDVGVRAVFAFPLRVGGVRFGALSLYSDRPGPLSDDQHAEAVVMAQLTAEVVLLMQANAPPATLAAELINGANTRAVVHQAAGMMAGQLDVTVARALVELRAYAFATNRRLVAVAEDVVDRRLSFSSV
ncbi:MAG: GAF and ANTAR domain-containing protein [Actinomycetota bacterium]|nr:GAF and ANTAR domain-containing protein [Actinomycetota bacterium]